MLYYYTLRDDEYIYLGSQPARFASAGYLPSAAALAQLAGEYLYTLGW